MSERSTLRIAYHNSIRYEEPNVHLRVKTGQITVTDPDGKTAAYTEDDEFTTPDKGGVSIFCLEQAIVYEVVKPKPKKKPAAKKAKVSK